MAIAGNINVSRSLYSLGGLSFALQGDPVGFIVHDVLVDLSSEA